MTVSFDFLHAYGGNIRSLQWNQYLWLYSDNLVFKKELLLPSSFQIRQKNPTQQYEEKPNQTTYGSQKW